jgi:hypothetical protein
MVVLTGLLEVASFLLASSILFDHQKLVERRALLDADSSSMPGWEAPDDDPEKRTQDS